MSRFNGLDMYKTLERLDSELIEEAEMYHQEKKVLQKYGKVFWMVGVAAAVIALFSITQYLNRGIYKEKQPDNNELYVEQNTESMKSVNIYAAGLDEKEKVLYVNNSDNADATGVVVGKMKSDKDKSIEGEFFSSIRVVGEEIKSIKYKLISNNNFCSYSLLRMKEAERDSQEYLNSSHRLRKQIDGEYVYYISENLGSEYEKTDGTNGDFWNWVRFEKTLTPNENVVDYGTSDFFKAVCDDVTLELQIVFNDGTSNTYLFGFKQLQDDHNNIALYVKKASA